MKYEAQEIDLGFDMVDCEYDLSYDYSPPEPMVRYYSDGSGYPGCPGYFTIYDVVVVKVSGQDGPIELTEELRNILIDKFEDYRESAEEEILDGMYDEEDYYED